MTSREVRNRTTRAESHRTIRKHTNAPEAKHASSGINSYSKALRFVQSLADYERQRIVRYTSVNFDLDRMRTLLKKLGNPHEQFKSVHIAGTKGKGSTCAMVASMVQAAGYKTGLYTSPHLIDIRERIQINGEMISHAEFARLIKAVEPIVVPPVNTEQSLRQKQIDVAVLGGILRDKALKNGGIRPLFSDFDLLGAFTAGTYVLTKQFIQRNPDTVRTFVAGVAKAIDWSRTTPQDQVIARMVEIIRKRGRNEDSSAIQYWRSFGVTSAGGRIADKEFALWVDWLTERGEVKPGQVKAADIFTNEYNGSGA